MDLRTRQQLTKTEKNVELLGASVKTLTDEVKMVKVSVDKIQAQVIPWTNTAEKLDKAMTDLTLKLDGQVKGMKKTIKEKLGWGFLLTGSTAGLAGIIKVVLDSGVLTNVF